MNSWPTKKLSDVCVINPKKSEVSSLVDDTVISFVPMSSVDEFSQSITCQEDKHISEVRKGYTYFKKGDVLFAKITPCMENGKVAHAKNLKHNVGFGSTEFHVIRAGEEVLPEYVYSLVSSSAFRTEAETKMTGSAGQKRVPKDFIEEYEIVIPPIEEQKRIVGILEDRIGKVKEAIKLRKDAIADSEKILSAKLNDIFAKGKEQGWEEKTMGEVCDLSQGLAINAKTKHLLVERSDLPLLRIKDLREGTEVQYISEEGYPEKALVNEDDILYSRTGQIGLVFRGRMGVLHNNLFKITPGDSLNPDFLYWFLHEPRFKKNIITLSSRTAQPDITHKNFKTQKIWIPDFKTQQMIVKELEESSMKVDELKLLQAEQLEDLKSLERAYLHEAFNGELV